MPKRCWGYDKNGNFTSVLGRKLPKGMTSKLQEPEPKKRGRPAKAKVEENGEHDNTE